MNLKIDFYNKLWYNIYRKTKDIVFVYNNKLKRSIL